MEKDSTKSFHGSIYKITNSINSKIYIGQTRYTIASRWKKHIRTAEAYLGDGALQRAIRKYGKDSFTVEEVHTGICSLDELNRLESHYIAHYDCMPPKGYNMTTGGESYKRSKETLAKFSARRGWKHTEAAKEKMSKAAIGRPVSDAIKKQLSRLMVGNKNSDPSILRKWNAARTDKTVHSFYHPKYGTVETYANDLAKRYGLNCSAVHKLVDGGYKSTRGWILKGNSKPIRGKIYEIRNTNNGEVVTGTIKELAKSVLGSIDKAVKLTSGRTKQTRQGWELSKEISYE